MEQATFAMGCFWGPQVCFDELKGVIKTEVGFMGGSVEDPSYEQVCSKKTGHAEVVHIEFDPSLVSYEDLLELFWSKHDPTQMNRQGPDVGSQYRSAIFYHNEEQKKLALNSKEQQQEKYEGPVVTEIVPAKAFYKAEEYHQKYLEKRGQKTCG